MTHDKSARIEHDISFWLDKEKRLKELFRGDIVNEKHFLNEKLRYFNSVQKKYQGNLSEGEKIMLNTLKGEIKKLERQLYPNPIVRLIVRADKLVMNYLERRREFRDQNKVKYPPLTFNQRKLDGNQSSPDGGIKENLKAGTTQGLKKEQQDQTLKADPLKNSIPQRHLTANTLRTSKEIIKKEASKLNDDTSPKKRLRHRLH